MIFNCIKCDFCEEEDHSVESYTSYKWTEDAEGNPVVEAKGTCSVCGEAFTKVLVPDQEFVDGKEPTCEEGATVKYFVNSNGINTSKVVAVEAVGHDIVFHDAAPATCVEKGWNKAELSNGLKLEKGQVRKYGQCSVCGTYFRAVLDEATGEIVLDKDGKERITKVSERDARTPVDTVTGHDYKVRINWVEIKDEEGNVIGYDRNATKTATLECTREGCLNANSVGGNWGNYSLKVYLKPCFGGNLDLELEGKCTDEDGAVAKYTATVDPDKTYNGKKFSELCDGQTFAETKTVKVNGHVYSDYSVTSVEVNGKQVHQHAPACMYCGETSGEYVNCTPTAFTADDITAEGHTGTCACGYKFTEVAEHTLVGSGRAGDINVNGYVHNGNIMKCSVCGYETIEEDHEMKSTKDGHYCTKCGSAEEAEPHTYTEWTKKANGSYVSKCSVCGYEKTAGWDEVLKSVPVWANNGAGYVTVTYESGATCTFRGETDKVIPEGLKLVFESDSTCNFEQDVTVNGVIIVESGAHFNTSNHIVAVNDEVKGAAIIGADIKYGEQVNTQKAFEEALSDTSVDKVVVDADVELKDTLNNVTAIKVNEGATLKVTVTLPAENLTITGEGTVELANKTPETNGTNLVTASKSGISKVVVSEDAKSDHTVVAGAGKNLTVELESGKTVEFTGEASIPFHVQDGGNLTIIGSEDKTSKIKNTNNTAIQNLNSTLNVSNVTVEAKTGVYVMTEGSSTTLTGVVIKAQMYGVTSNNAESPAGIGTITLNDCTISSELNAGLYLPAKGNVVINGGKITGWSAILTKGSNLELKGVTLRSEGNRYDHALSGHAEKGVQGQFQAAADGAVLLIVSQGSYAKNQTVKINIDDSVKFEQNCTKQGFEGSKNFLIEVVGTKTATSTEVAGNLVINYSGFKTESDIQTEAPTSNTTESLKDIKKYLVDIDEACRTSIKLNDKEYNTYLEN